MSLANQNIDNVAIDNISDITNFRINSRGILQYSVDGGKFWKNFLNNNEFITMIIRELCSGSGGSGTGTGADGKSAYQIWLDHGNTGTEEDFLKSLIGKDGKSAYQIWLEAGHKGTEEDFLNSLKGSGSGTSEVFDREDKTAVTVGGLNAGSSVKDMSTKDVLEAILFPYQKPTVSFTINPSTTVYESGNTVSSIIFTISAGKKSKDIKSIKVYNGSTLLTTITDSVSAGGTFTYTYNCNITSNTTLKVEVSDGDNIVSTTKNISFAYKSYYGYVANGTTVDETAIKALQNSTVKTSKALTYSGITCDDAKIVYAYPKSLGALTSILDDNGFGYIDSYDCTTVSVNGVDYYAYTMIDATTVDDFKQIFA